MTDVQLENGFTRIANELLEAIQMFQFTQNQLKVILALWRNTYGWGRKECEFSLGYIQNATNLDRKRASATLQTLINAKVIIEVEKGSANKTKIVSFNKNYTQWEIKRYKGSGESTTSGEMTTSGKPTTTTSGHSATTTSGQNATQKRNNKEILKKEDEEEMAKDPVRYYQQIFVHINSFQIESLVKWVEDFNGNEDVVNLAIEETAKSNPKQPFRFLESILKDWHLRQLFTVEDVLKDKEKAESKKVANFNEYRNKKASEIDWEAL